MRTPLLRLASEASRPTLALKGVEALVQTISAVAGRLTPEIDVLGVLMTRVDGRNRSLNETIERDIEARFGDAVLPVQIGFNSSLAKAQVAGQDIYAYDADSRGAVQYRGLAEKVLELTGL